MKRRKDIHGLIQALMYKDLDIQWRAAEALGEMGADGIEPPASCITVKEQTCQAGGDGGTGGDKGP